MRIFLVLSLLTNVFLFWTVETIRANAQKSFGATMQYGLPGIYQQSPGSIASGTGAALNVDSQGNLIASTSTVITITTQ